jgi:uncharacterized membrane protein required for colicin V production
MFSMIAVFWMFVLLFAINGSMRGWAKELLVSFSVILALAFIAVMENLMPVASDLLRNNPELQYYFRMTVLLVIVFFGYQSPRFSRIGKATEKRDRITDLLMGFFMGALSGYMVIGTLWSFMDANNYQWLKSFVIAPSAQTAGGEAALWMLKRLPPIWLGRQPNIYIAVVLAFIFVIVIFI